MNAYKSCWKYIKASETYIWIVAVIFFGFAIIGFMFPIFFQDFIRKMLEDIVGQTQGLGFTRLFLFIFENNLTTSFIGLVLGFIFALIPLFLAVFNGYVLGAVMSSAAAIEGIFVLFRLLPHGIFELPAVILSLALGLKIGLGIFSGRKKSKSILAFFVSFILFFLISDFILGIFMVIFGFSSSDFQLASQISFIPTFLIIFFFAVFILSSFIGTFILGKNQRKENYKNFKFNLANSFRVFLFVVVPLLIIAAIIEGGLILFLG